MAKFKLTWSNAEALASPSTIGQRALYKRKTDSGQFNSAGFVPANDLPKTATTATTPTLSDNVVYEFKVKTICTFGEVDNFDGVKESIIFSCITPTVNFTNQNSTASLDLTGSDITKVRFILKKQSDNSVVFGPQVVTRTGNTASASSGNVLIGSTDYYWQTELYANVNGVEVISSVCQAPPFTTQPDICEPVTSLIIEAV